MWMIWVYIWNLIAHQALTFNNLAKLTMQINHLAFYDVVIVKLEIYFMFFSFKHASKELPNGESTAQTVCKKTV